MTGQKVGTLSGGQKNRLLLAKILADPKSLLILDEPTNDLDMETLDMLEEILSQYNGTLVVVSHDRDFLDQTVTKIIAFEGNGLIDGCVGGYSDWLEYKRKRKLEEEDDEDESPSSRKHNPSGRSDAASPARERPKKLTYKLQFELENLPDRIERLQKEIEESEAILDDAELFSKDRGAFDTASKRLASARMELESSELRWLELDEMKKAAGT
jgi:ATP-binding cassette subfamily F protein uup